MKSLRLTSAFIILSTSNLAFAGEGRIVVFGSAKRSAPAEYSKLGLSVTSICYDSAVSAKDANAALANQLVDRLRSLTSHGVADVRAFGGAIERRTETVWDGNSSRIICENKWRASNSIVLKSENIEALPSLQDDVLTIMDPHSQLSDNLLAQTTVDLSQPSFHLQDATEKRLRQEAQSAAYQDARAQFDSFNAICSFVNPQLVEISPPEVQFSGMEAMRDAAGGTATPIIPGDITVSVNWKFVWSYDGEAGCSKSFLKSIQPMR